MRRPAWPIAVGLLIVAALAVLVGIWTWDERWLLTGLLVAFATGVVSAVVAAARFPL